MTQKDVRKKIIGYDLPGTALTTFILLICLSPVPAAADTSFFERRNISFAKRAFQDNLYDVSKIKLTKFLEKYPESDFKHEALWLLAQSHYFLGENEAALNILNEVTLTPDDKLIPGFLYWRAQTLAASDKLENSIAEYRKFLKSYPDHELAPDARLGLSKSFFRSGDSKEARKALTPLLSLADDNPAHQAAMLQECRILVGTEQYAEALKVLIKLNASKPTGELLYESSFIEGEIYRLQGDNEKALKAYRRITSDALAQPRSLVVNAWNASGIIHASQLKWLEASEYFEKAFRLALNSEQIQESVQRYLEAQFNNQTLTTAALEVRNFVNKNPETAVSGLYAIGKYFFLEKKYDAAITELDHLLMSYPDSEWVWPARLTMAEALLQKDQYDEALSALSELTQNSPRSEVKTRAFTLIGEQYFEQRKYSEAAQAFQQAAENATLTEQEILWIRTLLTLSRAGDLEGFLAAEKNFFDSYPSSEYRVDLLMEKAQLYEVSGKNQEARALYSELIQKKYDPEQTAEALFRLGYSSYQSGDNSDALNAFTALEKDHSEFPRLDEVLFYKIQTEYLLDAKSPEEIVQSLTDWIKRFPNSEKQAEALNYTGGILDNRGLHAEAVAQHRSVLERFPNTLEADRAAYFAGQSLHKLSQFADAITVLEQVRTDALWKPDARILQIVCYMRLGDYPSALKVSESVLKDNPRPAIESFARLRQAECLFTLASDDRGLYPDALRAAEAVINMEAATSAERNEAGYIKGEIFQKLNKSGQALQAFMDVVYGQLLPEENTQLSSQPEFHWFIKSGLAAANIKENQGDIRGAVEIYRILERIGEPSRNEFRRKIEDLKNEYFLYEST
ncbi:MAG: tetratricopeptide repeat protein [Verrucomicrobiota bacterium]